MTNQRLARVRDWSVPADLLLVTALAATGYVIALSRIGVPASIPEVIDTFLLTISPPSLVVTIAGLTLVFFFPGYAFLAALLPNRPAESSQLSTDQLQAIEPLSLTERIALSFGISLGLLSILGLVIAVSAWHYSAMVGGGFLLLTVIVGVFIGTARGHVCPFDRRADRIRRVRRFLTDEGQSTAERLVSIGLALTVLMAFTSLSVTLLVPHTGETYTGLTLLSNAGDDGPVAANYPSTLVLNEPTKFVVLVQNREREAMTYSLVVTEQRTTWGGEDVDIGQERELSRQDFKVPAGENERLHLDVVPTMSGTDLRIAFYLYRSPAPAEVTDDTAYRQLYVWVDVRDEPPGS